MSFYIVKGDIFEQKVDAIVLTASPKLELEGPIGHKAHEICGERLTCELEQLKAPTLSECVITNAYNLPEVKRIIHVVTPRWNGGEYNEDKYLKQSYLSCLRKLKDFKLNSIAFPLLSTGTYKYPEIHAVTIAAKVLDDYCKKNEDVDVKLVIFKRSTWENCRKHLNKYKVIEGKLSEQTKEYLRRMNAEHRGINKWYKPGDEEILDNGVETQEISQRLEFFIKKQHKTKVECYTGVISKAAFDKIMNGKGTTENTLISLGINIGLDEYEINELISPLGGRLDNFTERGRIIINGIYQYSKENGAVRIESINEELAAEGCQLLKTNDIKISNKK